MVRDRPVGVLYWFRQGKQRPLTRAMLPLISHLANQAAIALDNAQLVSHMEQQIAARTASVVADKEALATQMAEDRQAVSHLAEEVRRQTHNIIGLAGVVETALGDRGSELDREIDYLERIITSAETVTSVLQQLFALVHHEE